MSLRTRLIALRYDLMTMRLMPRFRRQVAKEKNRFITEYMAEYKRTGNFITAIEAKHDAAMQDIFMDNYQRIVGAAVKIAPSTVIGLKKSSLPLEFKRNTYDAALAAYFQTFGARRANLAAGTTASDVRRLFQQAMDAEANEQAAISAGLKARGLSAYRADVIARTETHQAAAFANRFTADEIADELDVKMQKAWAPVKDERTRESHAAMDENDWIDMDEKFNVGGELMDGPGDPSASPENVIQCRCVELHRIK